jgi:hypothetical protein
MFFWARQNLSREFRPFARAHRGRDGIFRGYFQFAGRLARLVVAARRRTRNILTATARPSRSRRRWFRGDAVRRGGLDCGKRHNIGHPQTFPITRRNGSRCGFGRRHRRQGRAVPFCHRRGDFGDGQFRREDADAWHHRSDAITSAGAFIGISIALIGGKNFRGRTTRRRFFARASSASTAGFCCARR